MKNTRILAIALALLMIFPAMAAAEAGSFTLRVSDPVLTVSNGDSTSTQDFTGVALQLGGVTDGGAHNLLSLALIAQDSPAISAMLGINGEEAYALATGISHVLVFDAADLDALANQMGAPGIPSMANGSASFAEYAATLLEPLQFEALSDESVQFYDTTASATRYAAHLTSGDLQQILGAAGTVAQNATADISFFISDNNIRIEATVSDVEGEDIEFVLLIKTNADATPVGAAWIGAGDNEINAEFQGALDARYEGEMTFDIIADFTNKNDGPDQPAREVQLHYGPFETNDGTLGHGIDIVALEGDAQIGTMQLSAAKSDSAESYQLYAGDAAGDTSLTVAYTGTIEQTATGLNHKGELGYQFVQNGEHAELMIKIDLNNASDIEGKLPDISTMPQIKVEEMTPEQGDQLMTEVQQMLITASGQLMSIPALASLIASTMSSMLAVQ